MRKKETGFTLIELLAIIVILAIIAVITVPIILNIIENSKKGSIQDSAYGFKDAVQKFYFSKLSEDRNFMLKGTYKVSDGKFNNEEIQISGEKPKDGSLTYQNNILKSGCLEFDKYKVVFKDGKITTTEKGECEKVVFIDLDNSHSINIGDIVKISIDEFYVIAQPSNSEVKLLAKYNLNSNYRQESGSYYSKPMFSSTKYWYDTLNNRVSDEYPEEFDNGGDRVSYIYVKDDRNNLYTYVNNYKLYLEDLGITEIIDARLMSYMDANGMGCTISNNSCNVDLNNQPFWLGSGIDYLSMIYVFNNQYHRLDTTYYHSNNIYGIRPLIVIPESAITIQ